MEEFWPSAIDNTALKSLEKKKEKKNQMNKKFPVQCITQSSPITTNTLMIDIKPVLNCRTPLPSLLGSRF